MVFDLHAALHHLVEVGASDLHLKVPARPSMRLDGALQPVPGTVELTQQDTEAAVRLMLRDPEQLAEFESANELDFSYAIDGLARFRVNAFRQRGSVSIVIRAIPFRIRSLDELQLPPVMRELAEEERGIILVTGTTGSGK
jgi:twitching motility protein PilT